MKTCEWCGEEECSHCYETNRCDSCGHEYCNRCINNESKKCKACQNIIKIHKDELINDGYRYIFDNKKKVEVGISSKYIVYFKKKFFGIISDSSERLKKNQK